MSKQGDAAYAWFLQGYNCSQSVVAAFAPQLGLTEEMALRLSAGFGAGIGRMREVCGAFCGVVTVLSMVYADPTDPKDKSRMYALVQQAAEQYRTRNGGGSIICRELLAKDGTELYRTLQQVDPTAAAEIHPNNKNRVVRALELYYAGITKTAQNAASRREDSPYEALYFVLRYRDGGCVPCGRGSGGYVRSPACTRSRSNAA